jgi:hypothetical protein
LVREFEANLAALRNSFVVHQTLAAMTPLDLTNYVPTYHCVGSTAQPLQQQQRPLPPPLPQPPLHHQQHSLPVFRQVEAFMDSMQQQQHHHHQLVAANAAENIPIWPVCANM